MNTEAQAIPYPAQHRGLSGRSARDRALSYARRGFPYLPVFSVTLLALLLNAWALSRAGYGNTYYAAAARSMTMSWSNFFFGAFDPGGFITVDKPPAFLWVGALSARGRRLVSCRCRGRWRSGEARGWRRRAGVGWARG